MSNFNILKSMMYLDVWGTYLIITIDIKASYPFRGLLNRISIFLDIVILGGKIYSFRTNTHTACNKSKSFSPMTPCKKLQTQKLPIVKPVLRPTTSVKRPILLNKCKHLCSYIVQLFFFRTLLCDCGLFWLVISGNTYWLTFFHSS
jgi:hypothetical protein